MKRKSMRVVIMVLFVCLVSFFAAGNALAAYSYAGAKIFNFGIFDGGGNLVNITYVPLVPDKNALMAYAQSSLGDPAAQYYPGSNPVSVSSTYSGATYSSANGYFGGTNPVPFMYGEANAGFYKYDGSDKYGFHDGISASAVSTGTYKAKFTFNGATGDYSIRALYWLGTSGEATHNPGAYSDGYGSVSVGATVSGTELGTVSTTYFDESRIYSDSPNWWSINAESWIILSNVHLVHGTTKNYITLSYDLSADANCPVVPIPSSLLLLAPGMAGLIVARKRLSK
jgi:hypothetical protein